ncbi:hypothetical protein PIB30_033800 [Stylosanthes scabra]|uniref:Uncharacterized protein n=1 Tax=Stylosanthes scabra TaxID=79078 RepID=A0ABU6WFL1_9FABA|nr:hypothetical protein [Stylosanthes scabra]
MVFHFLGYSIVFIFRNSLHREPRTLMAAPGRGRGRGRGPHPPVVDEFEDGQQEFFAAMTNMANTIQAGMADVNAAHAAAAAAGGGGGPAGERPMTLESFSR